MIVYSNPSMTAAEMRQELYRGNMILRSDLPAVAELVEHTLASLTDLFAPHDPVHAHEHHSPAELAQLLGAWKPAFIHDARSLHLVQRIVREAGFEGAQTYLDVPKPRTSYPVGHLTTGVAFAFPWHRDTWYSAPAQQINWWLPVAAVQPTNAMSFDPPSFASEVPNDSDTFDYYAHNRHRHTTAAQVTREVQSRPGATGHAADDELTIIPDPGSILLFSGAQLHRSIPNTSGVARYSVDFRTIDAPDLDRGLGAPVLDVRCTGTSIRDFHRITDGAPFDEAYIVERFGAPPDDAELVFVPTAGDGSDG